jgi:hypothetical protein
MTMGANPTPSPGEQELVQAQLQMTHALRRVSALRRAALDGSYDASEFDRAVAEYRRAEAALVDTRRESGCSRLADEVSAIAGGLGGPPPFEPTPLLLFARWLVRTGRLSDWDSAGRPGGAGQPNRP